ncbi:MAG: isochorismatase family cysteine hydrolase [Pyrinomonadaceae bacterium]
MQDKTITRDKLKGNTDQDKHALLLVDLVTDFEFADGDRLYENTLAVVDSLAGLKTKAKDARVPVVYVNDNCGNWQEDFEHQVKRIHDTSKKGRQIIEKLKPDRDDYYVLKPQRSGFYETPLSFLLASLTVTKVIVAGITTDICVLFTAHDAYMRGFDVVVPTDGCAAVTVQYHREALSFLHRVAEAKLRSSDEITSSFV